MPMGVNCGETDNASTLMTSAVGQPTRRRGFSCWDALVKTTTSTDKVSTYDNVQLVTLVSGWMVYFVWQTLLLLLLYLWQATPLGVRSAKRRHQSPEWTILSHVDCFIQGEVVGFQVLLDSLHPRSTRASWWSRPVLQRGRHTCSGFRKSLSYLFIFYLLDINWLSPVDLAVVPLFRPPKTSFDWLIDFICFVWHSRMAGLIYIQTKYAK